MSTASLLAKLGPKVANIPTGARRAAKSLESGAKTLTRVRHALGLCGSGVEPMTRVHGSQTHSADLDALSPQDVAAALGFVSDPLAREVFCLARWPGYSERDISETRIMILRRVMDEGQRRTDEAITAWLAVELSPSHSARVMSERIAAQKWPLKLAMYPRMVDLAMRHLDGSGLPDQEAIAKRLKISSRAFRKSWRSPMEWIYDDLLGMARAAESQFRGALK